MKKCIMSKLIFALFFASFLLSVFTACSDLSDNAKNTADTEKVCMVSGKVSVGNAAPSSLSNAFIASDETCMRSATSSLKTDGLTYSVYARKGSGSTVSSTISANGTFDTDENTYSIGLPVACTWTVYVIAYINQKYCLEGSAVVEVENLETPIDAGTIVLQPGYSTVCDGAINLTFKDNTSKIASVSYEVSPANSLEESEINFADGVATLKLTDILPRTYEMTFSFKDSVGNVLYRCYESIVVFSGFTTDTWVGSGSHLVKNTETGAVEFVITDDLITAFGTETVPKTQMVLYEQTETGYNYYFTNDATEKISGKTADMVPFEAGNNSFCFDSKGNIYAIQDYNSEDGAIIVKNGKDVATISPTLSADLKAITVDTKNDILYGFAFTSGNVFTLYKYTSLISTFSESEKDTSAAIYSVSCGNLFTVFPNEDDTLPCYASVHDGVAYVLLAPERYSSYDAKYHVHYPRAKLLVFSLSDATEGAESNYFTFSASSDSATLYDLNLAECFSLDESDEIFEITDMLYQDGNVYMLVRYVSLENSAIYSTGSVVRFNLWNGAVMTPGFGEPFDTSSAKFYIYNGGERMYNSAGATDPVLCSYNSTLSPEICVPATKTSGLYGPSKFIAIKPKKLVIADEGYAVYTNDDGALSYKNVNRVVMVDLEDFAIVSDETDCTFGTDSTTAVITKIMSSMDNGNFFIMAGLSGSLYNSIGSTFGTSAGSKFAYGVNLSE